MCMTLAAVSGPVGVVATDTRVTNEFRYTDGRSETRFSESDRKLRPMDGGFAVVCGNDGAAGFEVLDRLEGEPARDLEAVRKIVREAGEGARDGDTAAATVYVVGGREQGAFAFDVGTDGREELLKADWAAQVPYGLSDAQEKQLSLKVQYELLEVEGPYDLIRAAGEIFSWATERTDHISDQLNLGFVLYSGAGPGGFHQLLQPAAEVAEASDKQVGLMLRGAD